MKPIQIRISKRRLRTVKLIAALALILLVLISADKKLRPIITNFCNYQAHALATRSINDAVLSVIDENDMKYTEIILLSYGENGEVSSLTTDIVTINRLKSEITNAVEQALSQNAQTAITIPMGTVFGGQYLSGRGPDVTFKILPAGYVNTRIYNNFESAGINQTLHQIMLAVDVNVIAMMPLYSVETQVTTNITIAETVIIGKVPGAFTEIKTENGQSSLDLFHDYKAKN